MNRGKLAVTAIVGAALALAAFAWWWNYEHGRQSHEFWGREQILLIRRARQVELLRLTAAQAKTAPSEATESQRIDFADGAWEVAEQKDISHAQGLIHARFALTADASFQFDKPLAAEPHWEYAARFTEGQRTATVLFDFTQAQVGIAEHDRAARVVPKIISGWRQFVSRHLHGAADDSQP